MLPTRYPGPRGLPFRATNFVKPLTNSGFRFWAAAAFLGAVPDVMGCAGSKATATDSGNAANTQEPWFQKALDATKEGLQKAGDTISKGWDASKPHVANAAEKAWAASKAAAAAGKEFAIDVADSSKATTQMAILETKYRATQKRLDWDKQEFGGRVFKELQSACGEADGAARDGQLVGCLEDGSAALALYRKAIARFKEHEADMQEARREIAELKEKVKEVWKNNKSEQAKIEKDFAKIESSADKDLPMGDVYADNAPKKPTADESTEVQSV